MRITPSHQLLKLESDKPTPLWVVMKTKSFLAASPSSSPSHTPNRVSLAPPNKYHITNEEASSPTTYSMGRLDVPPLPWFL